MLVAFAAAFRRFDATSPDAMIRAFDACHYVFTCYMFRPSFASHFDYYALIDAACHAFFFTLIFDFAIMRYARQVASRRHEAPLPALPRFA